MAKKPPKDEGHELTEKRLKAYERRLAEEYRRAQAEIAEKLDDYLMRFDHKDRIKRDQVARGVITEKEYAEWRKGQLIVGQRWEDARHEVAMKFNEVNQAAMLSTREQAARIYAENVNFGTYIVEKAARVDTGFTLVNEAAVVRLVRDNPRLLPKPGEKSKIEKLIKEGKAIRWNEKQVQSIMLQGILQGESIPKLANRVVSELGEQNYKSAVRAARTMATGAQNGGRMDAFNEAAGKGVKMKKMWLATLDGRTRHSHAALDGESVPLNERFGNGLDHPGDPEGSAGEIYNCRCSMIADIQGIGRDLSGRDTSKLDGVSYEDWKAGKYKQKSQDIEAQTIAGELERFAYIAGYRR